MKKSNARGNVRFPGMVLTKIGRQQVRDAEEFLNNAQAAVDYVERLWKKIAPGGISTVFPGIDFSIDSYSDFGNISWDICGHDFNWDSRSSEISFGAAVVRSVKRVVMALEDFVAKLEPKSLESVPILQIEPAKNERGIPFMRDDEFSAWAESLSDWIVDKAPGGVFDDGMVWGPARLEWDEEKKKILPDERRRDAYTMEFSSHFEVKLPAAHGNEGKIVRQVTTAMRRRAQELLEGAKEIDTAWKKGGPKEVAADFEKELAERKGGAA